MNPESVPSYLIENQNYQISLKLILRNDVGQVLVLSLPSTSSTPNSRDFPGGRIAESEVLDPFITSMQREVSEELGESVRWELNSEKPAGLSLHHYWSKRYEKEIYVMWILFDAHYLGGEIKLSDEHCGFEWIDLNESSLNKYFTHGALVAAKNYLGLA